MTGRASIACAALCILAAASPCEALAGADQDSVERARESLKRRIEAAEALGVVSVRDAAPAAPPALRDGRLEAGDSPSAATAPCPTLEGLAAADAALAEHPLASLQRLRAAVLDPGAPARAEAEMALAEAYLALGFAEEAHAIAAAREGQGAAAIAGLALLAAGRPAEAARAADVARACADLHRLIAEAAAVLTGERDSLSSETGADLARLPPRLGRPIAEALAVHAIGAGGARAKAQALGPALVSSPSEIQSEAGAFIAAAALPDETAVGRLSEIAAAPGPLRAYALNELSARIGAQTPPEIVAAFEDDAAEALESGGGVAPLGALALALADRRARMGDVPGAAKALAVAHRHEPTRSAAASRFLHLLAPRIGSLAADDRLAALAAIAAEPALASRLLDPDAIRSAAGDLAELGATRSIARLQAEIAFPPVEASIIAATAALRAGDWASARAALEPHADDLRAAEMLARLSILSGDGEAELRHARGLGIAALADALWRQGDFSRLASLAGAGDAKASAEKILLAHLAAKRPPPRSLMKGRFEPGLAALFAAAPDPGNADPGALAGYSAKISQSLDYLKGAFASE